jgi:hypothetical protein
MEKYTIASKLVTVSFIHAGVFVPALNYDDSKIRFTFGLTSNPTTKFAYWDEDAYVSESVQNPNGPEGTLMDQTSIEDTTASGHLSESKEPSNGDKAIESEASSKKRRGESSLLASNKKVSEHRSWDFNDSLSSRPHLLISNFGAIDMLSCMVSRLENPKAKARATARIKKQQTRNPRT